jgi:hypothetical protein
VQVSAIGLSDERGRAVIYCLDSSDHALTVRELHGMLANVQSADGKSLTRNEHALGRLVRRMVKHHLLDEGPSERLQLAGPGRAIAMLFEPFPELITWSTKQHKS